MKLKIEITSNTVYIHVLQNHMNIIYLERELNNYLFKNGICDLKFGDGRLFKLDNNGAVFKDYISRNRTDKEAVELRDTILDILEDLISKIKYAYNKPTPFTVTGIYAF